MKPLITIVPQNSENGSCQYCRRGVLRQDGFGLDFPYSNLVRVEGSHIVTSFCPDCWNELLQSGPKAIDSTE